MELQKGDFGGLGDPMSSRSSRSLTPRTASVRRSGTVAAAELLVRGELLRRGELRDSPNLRASSTGPPGWSNPELCSDLDVSLW